MDFKEQLQTSEIFKVADMYFSTGKINLLFVTFFNSLLWYFFYLTVIICSRQKLHGAQQFNSKNTPKRAFRNDNFCTKNDEK